MDAGGELAGYQVSEVMEPGGRVISADWEPRMQWTVCDGPWLVRTRTREPSGFSAATWLTPGMSPWVAKMRAPRAMSREKWAKAQY